MVTLWIREHVNYVMAHGGFLAAQIVKIKKVPLKMCSKKLDSREKKFKSCKNNKIQGLNKEMILVGERTGCWKTWKLKEKKKFSMKKSQKV